MTATDAQGQTVKVSSETESEPIIRISRYTELVDAFYDFDNTEPGCPVLEDYDRAVSWQKLAGCLQGQVFSFAI